MTDPTPDRRAVGTLSNTLVALKNLPTHVGGGYRVDSDPTAAVTDEAS